MPRDGGGMPGGGFTPEKREKLLTGFRDALQREASATDKALEVLTAAALAGERCPFREAIPGGPDSLRRLAKTGWIRVEIGGLNWRVVTILKGSAAGKATAEPPGGWRPHLIIDAAGHHQVKRLAAARQKAAQQAAAAPPKQVQIKPRAPKPSKQRSPAIIIAGAPAKEFRRGNRGQPIPCHTDETIAEVARLWADPEMSAQMIGALLGLTKNQVIGIRDRAGLAPRRERVAKPPRVTIAFPKRGCLWIHGNVGEEGWHFCAAPPLAEDEAWCAKHHAVVYIPPGRRAIALKQIEFVAGKAGFNGGGAE